MANEPAHSLAEQRMAAATRRGVAGHSGNSVTPGFAERILRWRSGSYASSVHPTQARPTELFAPRTERR
jgi:hypothetical protein